MNSLLKSGILAIGFSAAVIGGSFAQATSSTGGSTALDFPKTNMDIGGTGSKMTEGSYGIFMDENDVYRVPSDSLTRYNEAAEQDRETANLVCTEADKDKAAYSDKVRDICKQFQPM